jgi:hypothetical protein
LEQLARFLEREDESAARSLREGMAEMFTLQRLKLPPSLYKCLATTNVIESPQDGVSRRTGNVTRWRDQGMVERWVASANFSLPAGMCDHCMFLLFSCSGHDCRLAAQSVLTRGGKAQRHSPDLRS